MQLALTEKEIEYLNELLDDGKSWGRPLCHPHRTLLEKWMAIKDEVEKTGAYIMLGTEENEIES